MAYSAEVRAQVVASVLGGLSYRGAARKFGVSDRDVRRWCGSVAAAKENAAPVRGKRRSREPVLGSDDQNLVDSFLRSMLKGLNAGAEVLSEKPFMRENPKAWNDVLITLMAKAERFVRPESDGVPGAGGESPGKG